MKPYIASLLTRTREELPITVQNKLSHYCETLRWELPRWEPKLTQFHPEAPISTKVVFSPRMIPTKITTTTKKELHSFAEL